MFLIQDGGASNIAGATADYAEGCRGWWRPRLTPAQTSWLNQAEMPAKTFRGRYLERGSWVQQEQFDEHVLASWPEYNEPCARPFEWTWTNKQMCQ